MTFRDLDLVRNAFLILNFVVAVTIIPAVSLFWSWWRSPFGRSFMALDIVAGLADLAAVFAFVLDPRSFMATALLTIFIASIGPVLGWRAWVLYRIQRDGEMPASSLPVEVVPDGD